MLNPPEAGKTTRGTWSRREKQLRGAKADKYQLLFLVSCRTKQQPVLLGELLSTSSLREVWQRSLIIRKVALLDLQAHVLNHIHHIIGTFIRHSGQQPGEMVVPGGHKQSIWALTAEGFTHILLAHWRNLGPVRGESGYLHELFI